MCIIDESLLSIIIIFYSFIIVRRALTSSVVKLVSRGAALVGTVSPRWRQLVGV